MADDAPAPRAARIKRRLLENERQIDVERARFTTESYRATEGQPIALRRAPDAAAPGAHP
jgi:pyruvate-formate lyase